MESFLEVDTASPFSIRNIPFGIFSTPSDPSHRAATVLGSHIVNLKALAFSGAFATIERVDEDLFQQPTLNTFASLPLSTRRAVRKHIQSLLSAGSSLSHDAELRSRILSPLAEASLHLPVFIGDYTDFCASEHHTKNLGRLIDTNSPPLPPAWIHLPIAYHGRASSVVVSGTPIRRPFGVLPAPNGPVVGPTGALDFELEMALVVGGTGNALGERVAVDRAEENVFGVVFMNDWSARDVQGPEMVPLGPFNGKNFATTISPWIVTLDAIKPFQTALPPRPVEADGTAQLVHLVEKDRESTYDVKLEVTITPASSGVPTTLMKSNLRYLSYSFPQLVAHHTLSGCPLLPGDLLGSGTISGPLPGEFGSMIELTRRGESPVELVGGGKRVWIEDGDEVGMTALAGEGVGWGEAVGKVLEAA